MSEDFSRTNELTISHQKAYAHINHLLNIEGKTLSDFPTMNQTVKIHEANNETNAASMTQMADAGQQQYIKLNNEQKEVVDTVLLAINNNDQGRNNCIHIDGPGGSGKTFIYTTLYNVLSSKDVIVCTMAFTGIAATLLPNGKIDHKTFGLPVPMYHDSSSNIKAQSKEGMFLKNTDVFIWDEAPIAPSYALKIPNRTLQHVMNNNLPFGGKIIILGGDFRQLLPIKINGTRSETLNICIKNSELWRYFTKFTLATNMRVNPNEINFAKYLREVKLIQENRFEDISKCAILSARNVDVNEINEQVTNVLDVSTEHIYTGIDSTDNCNNGELDEVILPEYLNSLNPSSLPPYKIKLKKTLHYNAY